MTNVTNDSVILRTHERELSRKVLGSLYFCETFVDLRFDDFVEMM